MKKTKAIMLMTLSLLILSLVLISNVSASGFSPSSLTFNLSPNERQCQAITITSDSSSITVSDIWAKNKDIEWKFSLFNDSASSHSISLDYPSSLSLSERTINICLSGTNIGEYHGIILIKEAQEGNSIIQMGVWLKVIILDPSQNSQTPQAQTPTKTSQATTTTNQAQTQPQTLQTNNTDNISQQNIDEQNLLITGGVTGLISQSPITFAIIFIIIILGLTLIAFRKKIGGYIRWKRYGY